MPEFLPKVGPAGENPQPTDETQTFTFPKKKANNNAMPASSIELAKADAAERALARAKEYDKISATEKDDWYYIQGEQQFGPVPLDELKAKIADLSIVPPINLAWHEGMEMWKPVHEIAIICGVSPLAATQFFKLPKPARRPGDGNLSEPVPEAQSGVTDQQTVNNDALCPSTIELAKAQAAERALARAKEYDKINATDKDDWYYIQGDEQYGPVPLDELKDKIADLSIVPPINLAWHEGMEMWKPVHEIAIICGISPLAATQFFKLPTPARRPGDNT